MYHAIVKRKLLRAFDGYLQQKAAAGLAEATALPIVGQKTDALAITEVRLATSIIAR